MRLAALLIICYIPRRGYAPMLHTAGWLLCALTPRLSFCQLGRNSHVAAYVCACVFLCVSRVDSYFAYNDAPSCDKKGQREM